MATTISATLPKITTAAETTFTVTALREFVTSTLSDAALGKYLDAALEAIDEELGPLNVTERLGPVRGDMLALSQEAESITSVVEDWRSSALTLAADDYELSDSGEVLYRLRTGTNPRWHWHGHVKVTYVRTDDPAGQIRVAVALVQLDLTHAPGLSSQQIGTWTEQYSSNSVMNYEIERASILATLSGSGPAVF
jgi:hypothetical protein